LTPFTRYLAVGTPKTDKIVPKTEPKRLKTDIKPPKPAKKGEIKESIVDIGGKKVDVSKPKPEIKVRVPIDEEVNKMVGEIQKEQRGDVEYAFKMKDGSIVSDKEVNTHFDLIKKNNINVDDVAESGWIREGEFTDTIKETPDEGKKFTPEELERVKKAQDLVKETPKKKVKKAKEEKPIPMAEESQKDLDNLKSQGFTETENNKPSDYWVEVETKYKGYDITTMISKTRGNFVGGDKYHPPIEYKIFKGEEEFDTPTYSLLKDLDDVKKFIDQDGKWEGEIDVEELSEQELVKIKTELKEKNIPKRFSDKRTHQDSLDEMKLEDIENELADRKDKVLEKKLEERVSLENDTEKALWRALNHVGHSSTRLYRLVEGGASNQDIKDMLGNELGTFGGQSANMGEIKGISYGGGKNPTVTTKDKDFKPIKVLKGKELIDLTRKILKIPTTDQTKKEVKYTVTTADIIPTRQGIKTENVTRRTETLEGKEVKEPLKKEDKSGIIKIGDKDVKRPKESERSGSLERSGEPTTGRERGQDKGDQGRTVDESRADTERSLEATEKSTEKERELDQGNYRITAEDKLGVGTPKEKANANLTAIKLLKELENANRKATPEEQKQLVKYVGWGGLSDLFDDWKTNLKGEREALKKILTEEEYEQARKSTLNAHYTTKEIIDGIWKAVKQFGVKGGRAIEPAAGIGHFIGLKPQDMKLAFTGVELDSLSGRIAKQLYPHSDFHIQGYEDTNLPSNFYDLAISNVPFANYNPYDPRAKELKIPAKLSLHDYFFAKSLALLKPNGVMAFVTSHWTMDKTNPSFRNWIGKQADFIGAIRLPNTAFKGNAGTEVTTDIIFLRKRLPNEQPKGQKWETTRKKAFKQEGWGDINLSVNEYFLDNPNMVAGKLNIDRRMYGSWEVTAEPYASKSLTKAIDEAIEKLPSNIVKKVADILRVQEKKIIDSSAKIGSHLVKDGEIYQKQPDGTLEKKDFGGHKKRVEQMIALRDSVKDLLAAQVKGRDDATIKSLMSNLNNKYDKFVQKYGHLNNRTNDDLFWEDAESPLLSSLEIPDKTGKTFNKAPIFTQRTVSEHKLPTKAESAKDALNIALSEYEDIELGYMARLTGQSESALLDDLIKDNLIYKNPEGDKWELAEEYLSGNVKRKLEVAETMSKKDNTLARNIEALKEVQPKDLEFSDISAKIGTPWVNPKDYRAFIGHLLDRNMYDSKVYKNDATGEWKIDIDKWIRDTAENTSKWGTERYPATKIVASLLNNRTIRVVDIEKDADGKDVKVYNEEQSELAMDKAEKIKIEFEDWLWKDSKRRTHYVDFYNRHFNNIVNRKYKGDHLTLPNLSNAYKLRQSQMDAIYRGITSNRLMLAHEVGAGKTAIIIATAMESKRLGLISKPIITVPKNTLPQWKAEWNKLYPTANILVADERNFTKNKRKKFLTKIATGNWDGIITSHSSFELIKVSDEAYSEYVNEKIADLKDEIVRQKQELGRKVSVKQLEKTVFRLEQRLKQKLDKTKRDDIIDFEELGIDGIFVDEADEFKNLAYTTKMEKVKGMGTPMGSGRSEDMMLKTRQMINKNGKIVFATGTPISNSLVEAYNMMKYLQPEILEERGLRHFDDWANAFGKVVTNLEVDVTGGKYKTTQRFSQFVNLPELMMMINEVWDIQTSKMLEDAGILVKGENLPLIEGGRPTPTIVQPNPYLEEYIQELVKRAEEIKGKKVEKGGDNMLVILQDGIKASTDMRLINPELPIKESKVETAIDLAYKEWKATADKKGTQLIFLDRPRPNETAKFNPYIYVRDNLIRLGVPAKEIAFIHDYEKANQKDALYQAVNDGKIRILMGSTKKMGAGTNVQKRLSQLIHLDTPYRPRDITQREGRIIRPNNTNKTVKIKRIVAKGSLDTFMWQMLEAKLRGIEQLMSGQYDQRHMEDTVDEYAVIKSAASDNPLVKEKTEVDTAVRKLQALKNAFLKEQMESEQRVASLPDEIARQKLRQQRLKEDITARPARPEEFAVAIKGKTIKKKLDALTAIRKHAINIPTAEIGKEIVIGEYLGYDLFVKRLSTEKMNFGVKTPSDEWEVNLGVDPVGAFMSLDNAIFVQPEKTVETYEGWIAKGEKDLKTLTEQQAKGFDRDQELKDKLARKAEIDRELKKGMEGMKTAMINLEIPKAIAEDVWGFVSKPIDKFHDFLWRFGEQQRLDPELYEKFTDTFNKIAVRTTEASSEINQILRGKKLTAQERAEITYAVEEKSYKIDEKLQPIADIFIRLGDAIDQINKEKGIYKVSFFERITTEISEKLVVAGKKVQALLDKRVRKGEPKSKRYLKLKAVRDKLKADLDQAQDMRYLTHGGVVQAIIDRKLNLLNEKERKVWIGSARRLSFKYKHRVGITPLREYVKSGLLKQSDVDIVRLGMQMVSEASFRWTMKDLFDYAKDSEYMVSARKKNIPAGWKTINPIVHGVIAPEYRNFKMHPLFERALTELKDSMTQRGGFLNALFSTVKLGQFIKPIIITNYDLMQAFYGGAMGIKTPMYMAQAIWDVLKSKFSGVNTPMYKEALKHNIFQKAYLPVVRARREDSYIEMQARRTLKGGALLQMRKVIEGITDTSLTDKQMFTLILPAMKAISNFTWSLDEMIRLSTYYAYKGEGLPEKEAGYRTAQVHGAYADISKKAADAFHKIFFVYAFRFLMPRQMFRIAYEPLKMGIDTIRKKAGVEGGKTYSKGHWKIAIKALASLLFAIFGMDAYMKYKGFDRDIPLYRWSKEVETPEGRKKMMVTFNNIFNMPLKWISRLLKYDPLDQNARLIQGLYHFAKWEIHPIHRLVFYDIGENRKSFGGGKVYNPKSDPVTKGLQISKYFIEESFRLLSLMTKDDGNGYYDLTPEEQADQQAVFDATFNKLEQAIIWAGGNKYLTYTDDSSYDYKMNKLDREYWKAVKYSEDEKTDEMIDIWYEKAQEYFKRKYKK